MIDSHQHFWQLGRGDYAWPNPSVGQINRDFAPDDLRSLLKRHGIAQTVLVQATDSVAETEFLLQIAAAEAFVAGVVGWVDLAAPDAIATIDRLRGDRWLKGLRPMLQGIEDTDWILRPSVAPALAHMAQVGLRFDALIQPRHLRPLEVIAHRHPSLPIVIDHVAKPRMGQRELPDPDWTKGMQRLSALPNVWCKLSGMITEIGPDWHIDDLRPFAQVVIDAFGPDRLMWGSDWPVVNLAGDYDVWVSASRELLADLPAPAQDRILSGAARAFYAL
jgi:L-fuconolactonase